MTPQKVFRGLLGGLFAALLASAAWYFQWRDGSAQRQQESSPALALPASEAVQELQAAPAPRAVEVERPFPRNFSVNQLLQEIGMCPASIHSLVEEVRPVYNLARVRAGNRLLIRHLEGRLTRLEYDIDDEELLVVEPGPDGYQARRERFRFRLEEVQVEGEISTTLWDSLISQGESEGLIMSLSDVFQWDVDFTSIRKGDSYSALVEKKYREGQFVKYGAVLAARFTTRKRSFYAFRYPLPQSGKEVYYDHKGQAVRKAFLKVPFHFNPRVSSGYSYSRFHPIHKVYRPHLGVDYGAPTGTPVLASASGKVVHAGWNGGFGKQVRIRHPNGFTTGYAHLSRIEVRAGQSVGQGQRIGRVGATGLATAAHLDYRVTDQSGRYLNPRRMISWPSDTPIERRYWKDFLALRDSYLRHLDPTLAWGCELDRATGAE